MTNDANWNDKAVVKKIALIATNTILNRDHSSNLSNVQMVINGIHQYLKDHKIESNIKNIEHGQQYIFNDFEIPEFLGDVDILLDGSFSVLASEDKLTQTVKSDLFIDYAGKTEEYYQGTYTIKSIKEPIALITTSKELVHSSNSLAEENVKHTFKKTIYNLQNAGSLSGEPGDRKKWLATSGILEYTDPFIGQFKVGFNNIEQPFQMNTHYPANGQIKIVDVGEPSNFIVVSTLSMHNQFKLKAYANHQLIIDESYDWDEYFNVEINTFHTL